MTTAIYLFDLLDGPSAAIFDAAETAGPHESRARFHRVLPKPAGPMALLPRVTRIETGDPGGRSVPRLRLPAESVLSVGLPPGHPAG